MFYQSIKIGYIPRKEFGGLKMTNPYGYCGPFAKIESGFHQMVISFLLSILLMLPLISCRTNRQNIARETKNDLRPKTLSVPRWYAELPMVDGCRFAYGYSGIYLDADRQKDSLLNNGAANMAKNDKVLIKAGWAGTQTTSDGLTASYILEKGWQGRASVLEKKLKIVREYRMENSIIALCAFCSEASLLQDLTHRIDDRLVNLNADGPPEWVKEPTSHPGYVYGVGTAPSWIKPGKAWEEAERQARAALAFNLAANHDILLKTISENTNSMSRKLSETKAEIALAQVTIIRHGYSRADNTFYALAQMPAGEGEVNTGN